MCWDEALRLETCARLIKRGSAFRGLGGGGGVEGAADEGQGAADEMGGGGGR